MVSPKRVRQILQNDPTFTNVAVVHCETSSGVINPICEIGAIVKELCWGECKLSPIVVLGHKPHQCGRSCERAVAQDEL